MHLQVEEDGGAVTEHRLHVNTYYFIPNIDEIVTLVLISIIQMKFVLLWNKIHIK